MFSWIEISSMGDEHWKFWAMIKEGGKSSEMGKAFVADGVV